MAPRFGGFKYGCDSLCLKSEFGSLSPKNAYVGSLLSQGAARHLLAVLLFPLSVTGDTKKTKGNLVAAGVEIIGRYDGRTWSN